MVGIKGRSSSLAGVLITGLLLVGCGSRVINHAPVEDRGTSAGKPASAPVVVADTQAQPVKLPGADNADKPGYYTVKPGDTLIKIGLDTGQNWKDIARWSGLDNPNQVEVGQVLRVIPPVAVAPPAGVAVAKPVTTTTVTAATTASASPASATRPAALRR